MFEIRHRYMDAVLYTAPNATTAKKAVEAAVSVGASLVGASLDGASLVGASLDGARLDGASLVGASLDGARLDGARLDGARLDGARLDGASGFVLSDLQAARLLIVPDTGDVIGWKKCRYDVLVKLKIPADARRHNATGRKCRAEFADVLEVIGEGAENGVALSLRDFSFTYAVGQRVTPDHYDPNRWNECAGGIHFFITRAEAEDYID